MFDVEGILGHCIDWCYGYPCTLVAFCSKITIRARTHLGLAALGESELRLQSDGLLLTSSLSLLCILYELHTCVCCSSISCAACVSLWSICSMPTSSGFRATCAEFPQTNSAEVSSSMVQINTPPKSMMDSIGPLPCAPDIHVRKENDDQGQPFDSSSCEVAVSPSK